ncbi:penicillin-binding protein [Streptomyces durbertensis]|uniref:Penicillin-binding protein n=1 Tax=Streptomyces durbertensis TaxID=2448886 RepID=A0ABR6EE43_9ACTN|nr:transglycosylase domain-containing protein [Streptomyces durbertensis]MBB1243596.1 penicillin-binding protein [Streptomyces durbertensis]
MSDDPNSADQGAPPADGRPRRTGLRRLLPTWRMVLGGVLLVLLLGTGTMVTGYLLVDIPDEPNKAAAAQSNVYLYSDGSVIAKDGEVNRENVTLGQIPKNVQHAVLAAEDRDFYNKPAVDPKAMARAAWNMLRGEGKQSGSTITQQYVKNYYLTQDRTLTRKAQEFFIAIKLDREVSKDEILVGYLNTSYYGRNAYGIQAAAQAYYGKNSDDLTTEEGAYLAALVNSPSAFDVSAVPENRGKAVARWNYVLDGMVKEGWLPAGERAGMKFPEPKEASAPTGHSGQRGYLVKAVKDHVVRNDIVDEERLRTGGYRITTTIDRKRQDAFVKSVEEQLLSKVDDSREVDRYVRAGGTSIDPETGEVVAMYGGLDYVKQFVNNATRRDYQAASTFKPFVYAAAMENGSSTRGGQRIGPYTTYDGTSRRPVVGRDGQQTSWAPQNEGDVSYGPISVTEGMDKSVNSVFAQMGVDVGPEKVKETIIRLGIPADTPELAAAQASVSLGTATPSTLDVAHAYTSLANHGEERPYTLVSKITRGGEEIQLPERETTQAISRSAADSTTAVLRSVVDNGSGVNAKAAGRPAAGKTGTAEGNTAAWFAGYTPDLVTVVAVMGQDSQTGEQKSLHGALGEPRISGGGYPARIWAQYTGAALAGKPYKDFDLEAENVQPPAQETPEAPQQPDDEPEAPEDEEEQDENADGGADDNGDEKGNPDGGQDQNTPGAGQPSTGDGDGQPGTPGGTPGGSPGTDPGTGDGGAETPEAPAGAGPGDSFLTPFRPTG